MLVEPIPCFDITEITRIIARAKETVNQLQPESKVVAHIASSTRAPNVRRNRQHAQHPGSRSDVQSMSATGAKSPGTSETSNNGIPLGPSFAPLTRDEEMSTTSPPVRALTPEVDQMDISSDATRRKQPVPNLLPNLS